MNFQKVAKGQDIVVRADEWNAMLGAGSAFQSGQFDVLGKSGQRRDGIIAIRNDTVALVKPYTALAIDDPLLAASAEAFPETFAFKGITPDPENDPTHRSRVAILLAPAAVGDIVPALIRGQITLPIHVYDVAHTRARVIADGTLQSCTFGPIRILGVHSTGADTQCLCYVDGFDGGQTLIKVPDAGIAGGTYAAPAETLCRIAWPHPTTGAATDHPSVTDHRVNVTNYGPEIAFASGKYVDARILAGLIIPTPEATAGGGLFGFELSADKLQVDKSVSATIYALNGIDFGASIGSHTLYDPAQWYGAALTGTRGICQLQDGKYYAMQSSCGPAGYL